MNKIHFHYADRKLPIQHKTELKKFTEKLFLIEKIPLERLDYIFCSDEYLLAINRQYLQHDYYTDIITFDLSEKQDKITGEVYISVDRIADNAKKLEETFLRETTRVIFHGALHLCGYKDKTPQQQKQMREMEEKYLKLYFK